MPEGLQAFRRLQVAENSSGALKASPAGSGQHRSPGNIKGHENTINLFLGVDGPFRKLTALIETNFVKILTKIETNDLFFRKCKIMHILATFVNESQRKIYF